MITNNLDSITLHEPLIDSGKIKIEINSIQNYLGNKKMMYDILSNDKRSFEFLPLTFTFNVLDPNYKDTIKYIMSLTNFKTWILKPALGLQGKDIYISNNYKNVLRYISKKIKYADWVLSEYIDKPFLLRIHGNSESGAKFKDTIGRKVHIRIYVLYTIINENRHIYLYDNSLLFSAVKEYSNNNHKNVYSNLTNLHLGSIYYNKKLKINGDLAYKDLSFPLKETINEIFGPLFYKEIVFPQIKNMLSVILDNSKEYINCEGNAFHRLAIDIMPDSQFKLYLLEINAHPGMNAPDYHWNGLSDYLTGLSDVLNNRKNKKFILIK
jgi:hypothetical protein